MLDNIFCSFFSARSHEFDDNDLFVHNEKEQYTCDFCHKTFGSALDLNEHYQTHLDDITTRTVEISDDDIFHCKYCYDEFDTTQDLEAHENEFHQIPSHEKTLLEHAER